MMTQRITRLTIRTVFVALVILLGISLAAPPAQAQGVVLVYSSDDDAELRTVDPLTGAILNSVTMTVSATPITNAHGLAFNPADGNLYVLFNDGPLFGCDTQVARKLGVVNPADGVIDPATVVTVDDGNGHLFSGIAFTTTGTLFGVTGDSQSCVTPRPDNASLFTIDPATGGITLQQALGTTATQGEGIGFNPADGNLYHVSGPTVLETIPAASPTTAASPVTLSGDSAGSQPSSITHWTGNFMVWAGGSQLSIVDVTTGFVRNMGDASGGTATASGMAFLGTPPDCTAVGQICGAASIGTNGPSVLYSIDQATGTAGMVGPIGFERVSGIAFSNLTGELFGVGETMDGIDTQTLITIDTSTTGAGVGTPVGATGTNPAQDITFASDGTLFGNVSDSIFTFDTGSGAATLVGSTGLGFGFGVALSFDLDGTLFRANTLDFETIDPATGAGTSVATLTFPGGSGNRLGAMNVDPATGTMFGAAPLSGANAGGPTENHLVTIDTGSGAVTEIGQTQTGLDAIAILPDTADIGVAKADNVATVAAINGNVIYTIVVANSGPGTANTVQVLDTFTGSAVSLVSAMTDTGTCDTTNFNMTNPPADVTCNLGAMANGAVATITIEVTATAGGAIVNDVVATTSSIDANRANNTAQVTTGVGSADITLTKVQMTPDPAMNPVIHPNTIVYRITVENPNTNTQPAGGVVVTDTLSGAAVTLAAASVPSQGTCDDSGFPTIVCNLGDIAVMGIVTIDVTVDTAAPGTITDTATATTATTDPDAANNTATVMTPVSAIDLALTKISSGATAVGFNVTYTITVTNNGNIDATAVMLTDDFTFQNGATANFVSATPSQGTCTPAFPAVPCDLGPIVPGGSATVSVVVTPTAGGATSTITNMAAVAATETDPITTNNMASTVTLVAAMEDFSLAAPNITILQGQTGTSTITVTPLPFVASVALSCSASIPLGACSVSPATVNPGNLPATATLTITTSGFFASNRKPFDQNAPLYAVWLPAAGFGVLGLVLVNEKRRKLQGGKARLVLIGLTLLLLLTLVTGCGVLGRDRSDEGTPGGTYPVTVTGVGGGQTHSIEVLVTVQP